MLRLLIVIILAIHFSYAGKTHGTLKGKLAFVHIIYRHGDRTPLEAYPTDPWRNVSNWPTGWGQLTNIGKEQLYELGEWVRDRYDSILPKQYSADDIYIRSSDVDRTLMSASSCLSALYKPVGKDIWNPTMTWQPIPVHTVPRKFDRIIYQTEPCPAYDKLVFALANSPEIIRLNAHYQYLYSYLTKWTGMPVKTIQAVQMLNNTLYIEKLYNKTLPEWTKSVFPDKDMEYLSNLGFVLPTYTRAMARLKVGPMLKEILDRFAEKSNGKLRPDRKMWMYSVHDLNIASILNALRVFTPQTIPYVATVIFELRLDVTRRPLISVFYKNSKADPVPISLPNCGIQCPLSHMYQLYKDVLPIDWKSECNLSNSFEENISNEIETFD